MIEKVLENLNQLYTDTAQERENIQTSIQNNARKALGEIMKVTGHYYDLENILIKTNDWTNRNGIHIESTDNGYHSCNFNISLLPHQPHQTKKYSDFNFNVRLDGNIDNERFYKNFIFSKMVMGIIELAKTNPEQLDKMMNNVHSQFYTVEVLDAKLTLIQHLINKATQAKELVNVEEVFDKGHLKIEHSKWIPTFGSGPEKIIDELKFTKNKTGTYTAELCYNGERISQTTRASKSVIGRLICAMLDIRNFFEF